MNTKNGNLLLITEQEMHGQKNTQPKKEPSTTYKDNNYQKNIKLTSEKKQRWEKDENK